MSFQPYDDPGWFAAFKRPKPDPASGLVTIRALFLSLAIAPFLILYILTNIYETVGSPEPLVAGVLAAAGSAGLVVVSRARNRPLAGSTAADVAGAYRTSFFVGFVGSEAPVLAGLVVSFLTEELWPYLMMLPFFVVGMALTAPSRRNLARRDEQLQRGGSPISLRAALNDPVPRQPKAR